MCVRENARTTDDSVKLVAGARTDDRLVVLEGLHSIKHACRFGAVLRGLWSDEPEAVRAMAQQLAPDLLPTLALQLLQVTTDTFEAMADRPPETRLLALAERPAWLRPLRPGPVVLLDRPRHPGNLGAVVRVAAAADASGVWCLGGGNPWSAAAIRGSAGLHFALPVLAIDAVPQTERPLIALADKGEPMDPASLPPDALFLFGSERDGLAPALLESASQVIAIPMRHGVSSLNLATAVAIVLYALRLRSSSGTGHRTAVST